MCLTDDVWCLQLELPAPDGAPRRPFRCSGFNRAEDAQKILDEVRALLALAPKDRDLTLRIARLLYDLPAKQPIPTPETVAKTLRAGRIDGVTTTVGAYLEDWLHGRSGLAEGTVKFYADHIRNHLTPHLGHLGIDALKPIHIQDMFTAIDAENQRIIAARDSTTRSSARPSVGSARSGPPPSTGSGPPCARPSTTRSPSTA